jgi:anti-sigma factor RsiW
MITHEHANELLASYALDAVDEDEQLQVEEHLAECPRCRNELDAFRDVAAALGNSVEPLPEGLWNTIASRLPQRSDEAPPPMPRLLADEKAADGAPDSAAAPARHRRFVRGPMAIVGAVAVAAAAVAAVLGIGLVQADRQASNDNEALARTPPSSVIAALETSGHQVVNLESSDHTRLAQFVIAHGRGYLVSSKLPALSSDETYQLWGLIGNQPISLGLLGKSPQQASFTVVTAASPTRLMITAEPASGAVVPSGAVVASGTI